MPAPGTVVVHANWQHWPCVFPQHGPEPKHRGLCGWALDLAGIAWRRSSAWHVSVSTRAGVARLDELIGLKS